MSIARIRILAIAVALAGSGVAISLLQARTSDWKVGDVFVAIGNGKYEVRSNSGALKETITIPTVLGQFSLDQEETGGCWFDSQFNLYTADPANTKVIRHELASPAHTKEVWVNTAAQANNGHSNSIVMSVNGDVFVGNPGGGSPAKSILRYRSDKQFKAKYNPATENSGIDWMDLATDQRTMYYTSKGRKIKKFDVSGTGSQKPDFNNTALPGNSPANAAYAIRLLPPFDKDASGGLLVADNAVIRRLNSSGNTIATWDVDLQGTQNDENAWQALNLDPDGVHFWAFGVATGRLFKFSLNDPGPVNVNTQVIPAIQTAGDGTSAGLCVMGEAQLQVQPLKLSTGATPPPLVDVTTKWGDPDAEFDNTKFYSYSTWRLRIKVRPNQNIVAAVSFTPQTTDLQCTGTPEDDFDCRFVATPAQCVPFFNDPSADDGTGTLAKYRCGFYRVKDMPLCQASNPSACPFAEELVPGDQFVPGTDDILSEILVNLLNPPSTNFSVTPYGPAPKGNPRLMRDPDSIELGTGVAQRKQFFIDATTAIIDWPAFGTGTPNDYSPVMRFPDTQQSTGTGCVDIIKPDGLTQNGGSNMKIIIEAKDGVRDSQGNCTGKPMENLTDVLNGKNISLAISNTTTNTLVIYCDTPGNSLGCFTPVNGQPGRYQSTFDTTNPPFIPSTSPYVFAVTSINVPSADPFKQEPGQFPPVCRKYWICPSGQNCAPPNSSSSCQ